ARAIRLGELSALAGDRGDRHDESNGHVASLSADGTAHPVAAAGEYGTRRGSSAQGDERGDRPIPRAFAPGGAMLPIITSFLMLNGGAALAAILAAARAAGGGAHERSLSALASYLVLVHSIVLWSGLAGWLTVGGAATCVAIALAGTLCWAWRSGVRPRAEP